MILKMSEMGNFWPKINIFELFFKSAHQVFLKLYLMTRIQKWLKVAVWIFKEKVAVWIFKENCYLENRGNESFWGSNFCKSVHQVFLKLYLMTGVNDCCVL